MNKFKLTEIVNYKGKNFPYLHEEELLVTGTPNNVWNQYAIMRNTGGIFLVNENDLVSTNTFLEEYTADESLVGKTIKHGYQGWFNSKILAHYSYNDIELVKVVEVEGSRSIVGQEFLRIKDDLTIQTPMCSC